MQDLSTSSDSVESVSLLAAGPAERKGPRVKYTVKKPDVPESRRDAMAMAATAQEHRARSRSPLKIISEEDSDANNSSGLDSSEEG